jgi:hypothetical protein
MGYWNLRFIRNLGTYSSVLDAIGVFSEFSFTVLQYSSTPILPSRKKLK